MNPRLVQWLRAVLALVLCLAGGCRRPDVPDRPVPLPLEEDAIHGVGYVEPASEVRRLSFARGGRITQCRVEPGQRVDAGAVLAQQDCSEEAAALALSEAELALAVAELDALMDGAHPAEVDSLRAREQAAAADLRLARQELDRQHSLSRNGAGLRAQVEDAQVRMESAEAWQQAATSALRHAETRVRSTAKAVALRRVDVARAQVQVARERLETRTLRAPVAGTVLEVLRRGGDRAQDVGDDPVLLLGDLDQLRVRAEVDETQSLRLREGALARIGGPNLLGRQLEGFVTVVKPIMGPKTVFSRAAAERQDLEMRQVFIPLPSHTDLPVGLKVDVRIAAADRRTTAGSGGHPEASSSPSAAGTRSR